MRRIAIINQKGGVGKTTTTVNLAAALAASGERVQVIDLDPQAHATLHLGVEIPREGPSLYNVLTGSASLADVRREVEPGLALIGSHIDLAATEVELVGVVGREVILRDLLDAEEKAEAAAADAAFDGSERGGPGARANGQEPPGHDIPQGSPGAGRLLPFDYTLMDCPPSLGVLTLNALTTAHEVIIPLQPHFLALHGLSKLLETIALVSRRVNRHLTVNGIVLCMVEQGTRLGAEVVEDLGKYLESGRGRNVPWADAQIFKARVRRNIRLAECPSFGQSIFRYAPDSHGAEDYRALAAEILAMAESSRGAVSADALAAEVA